MTGLNGTPMVSFADAFTPSQKWDLIAYIQELRQSPPAGTELVSRASSAR
jgi:hypothetical protein